MSEFAVSGKTKDFVKILDKEKLTNKTVLTVVAEKTPELIRSTNNLANVKLVRASYLNVFDILNADAVLFEPKAIKETTTWLLGKESK